MSESGELLSRELSSIHVGISQVMGPVIQAMDGSMREVTTAQERLSSQIAALQEELDKFQRAQDRPVVLDEYVQKLVQSRAKLLKVNALLLTVQKRVEKINGGVVRANKQLEGRKVAAIAQQEEAAKGISADPPF